MIVLERVEKVVLPTDVFLLFSLVLAIHCTRFRPCWSQSTLENISAQCKFFEISTDRFKQSYLFHCALQNSCVFAVLVYSLGQNEMMPTPPHSSCKINHTKVKMGHFTIFDFLSYWIFFWGGLGLNCPSNLFKIATLETANPSSTPWKMDDPS